MGKHTTFQEYDEAKADHNEASNELLRSLVDLIKGADLPDEAAATVAECIAHMQEEPEMCGLCERCGKPAVTITDDEALCQDCDMAAEDGSLYEVA